MKIIIDYPDDEVFYLKKTCQYLCCDINDFIYKTLNEKVLEIEDEILSHRYYDFVDTFGSPEAY